MIRVAFLIRSLNYGGAERQLATLVKALDSDSFDVTVISFYPGGPFEKEIRDNNIRLICMFKSGRWDGPRFLWRVICELKRLGPDIIHSYLVEPNLLAVLLKPLFRSTKFVWGILASDVNLRHYDFFARVTFRLQRLASRFPDLIIANSEAGRTYHLSRGFPAQKTIVIKNGVDTDQFRPDRESRKRIRALWGIANDAILIGLVGRLDPVKDHPAFLKAAALLARNRPDVRFVCVGTGPEAYASRLHQMADEYGISDRLIWEDSRSDMPAVYNAMDMACSSSSSEGQPNTIVEAMACGVHCVVTDAGDSALVVGDTGIVVPPNDPQALAHGLAKGLSQLADEQWPDPRKRIVQNFGTFHLRNQTQPVLKALIRSESILPSQEVV